VIRLSWNTGVHTGDFAFDAETHKPVGYQTAVVDKVGERPCRIEQPAEAVGSDARRLGVWNAV
jgi:hypothetical protein